MNKPYWSVKHVGTLSLLPQKLVRGRAYFIDDEQIIIIDHGQGPVTYGNRPGPQGQAGEPLPQLQDQIDKLSEASLYTQNTIWDISQTISLNAQTAQDYTDTLRTDSDSQFTHIHTLIDDTASRLQSQSDSHTQALLSLITTMQEKFTAYDNAIAILTKTVSNLYPSPYAEEKPEDPLDGETITTDAGTWKIEQTYLDDGTIMLELDADELLITTLEVGDKVDYDGSTWRVISKETQDGMLIIELEP